MFYTVYKITNKINGKHYIGMHQTNDLNDGYMGSGKRLRLAIEKYGIENFSKEILHIFDNETEMKNKERELVVISEMSYNLCDGGKGGFGYLNRSGKALRTGMLHSEETKQKISKNKKGKPNPSASQRCAQLMKTPEIVEKMKSSLRGKKHSEERRKKISESIRQRWIDIKSRK